MPRRGCGQYIHAEMGNNGSPEQVTTLQLILLVTSILGGGAALFAMWEAIRRRYRTTIGRRSGNYRRLARLGTGAQLSFFESVLGEPPADCSGSVSWSNSSIRS